MIRLTWVMTLNWHWFGISIRIYYQPEHSIMQSRAHGAQGPSEIFPLRSPNSSCPTLFLTIFYEAGSSA